MANLKLVISSVKGQYAAAMEKNRIAIATAATEAIKKTADEAKAGARAKIAAAGFSKKWQNATQANVYPKRGIAIDAAALIYNKIVYSEVFDEGAKISGSPLLWIPLPGTPARVGGKRMTPRNFAQSVAPLHSVNRPGHPPMLAAYITPTASGKLTIAKLRAGARRRQAKGDASVRSVAIFVGISTVQLRGRFGLSVVWKQAQKGIASKYAAAMKDT